MPITEGVGDSLSSQSENARAALGDVLNRGCQWFRLGGVLDSEVFTKITEQLPRAGGKVTEAACRLWLRIRDTRAGPEGRNWKKEFWERPGREHLRVTAAGLETGEEEAGGWDWELE